MPHKKKQYSVYKAAQTLAKASVRLFHSFSIETSGEIAFLFDFITYFLTGTILPIPPILNVLYC